MRDFSVTEFLISWYLAWALFVLSGCRAAPAAADGVEALNPVGEIPLVQAWCGERALRMGADSGSDFPVVLFAESASELGCAPRSGALLQPCRLPVSARRSGRAVAPSCALVLGGHAPMDGLVGWALLRQRPWYLHLAARRHGFADVVPDEVRRNWARFELKQEHHAALEIPGIGACMLDTGAPNAVYLPTSLWREMTAALPDLPRCFYYGESPAAGGPFAAECADFPVFQLGSLVLRRVRVCETFCADCPEIILGCDFLRRMELWLDAPHGVAYYRRHDSE